MNDLRKIFRSIRFALRGLRHAYSSDKSFRMEVHYGAPIFLALSWYLFPFEPWEIIVYTFSYLLILLVELLNTAVEKMIDRVHPDHHPLIGASKDIASASVLVAFVFAAIVVFVLIATRMASVESGLLFTQPFV